LPCPGLAKADLADELVLHNTLDQRAGSTAADSLTHGGDGTVVGGALWLHANG